MAATIAHLGLGFRDLYIRRGYAIIRGRQNKSYLRIGSLPCGAVAAIGKAAPLGFRGHLSRLGL
jgi:hypothetical protein